jgi:hypothetical protein
MEKACSEMPTMNNGRKVNNRRTLLTFGWSKKSAKLKNFYKTCTKQFNYLGSNGNDIKHYITYLNNIQKIKGIVSSDGFVN